MTLYNTLDYHDKHFFKDKIQMFESVSKEKSLLEINLFDDKTFELKTINPKSFCVEKGSYYFKKDTLFLSKLNNVDGNIVFGDVYVINKSNRSLKPIYSGLPIFRNKK